MEKIERFRSSSGPLSCDLRRGETEKNKNNNFSLTNILRFSPYIPRNGENVEMGKTKKDDKVKSFLQNVLYFS